MVTMVKPSPAGGTRCPRYHKAVEILGARWSGAILQVMLNGALRFGEIEQAVPELSSRMLSQRLRQLVTEGLAERRVFPDKPVRIEYHLTAKGQALAPVVRALTAWAEKWVSVPASGGRRSLPSR